jgi:hypothetical protein
MAINSVVFCTTSFLATLKKVKGCLRIKSSSIKKEELDNTSSYNGLYEKLY